MVKKEIATRIAEATTQGMTAINEAKELIGFAKKAGIDVSKQEGELLQRESELNVIVAAAEESDKS